MVTNKPPTRCLATFILLAAIAAFFACSSEKPTESATDCPPDTDTTGTLQWVGTEVLYGDLPCKHDRSILFVLVDWCGYCQRLKSETLKDTTVIQLLNENFNIACINPDVDSTVIYRDSTVTCGELASVVYGVHLFPTMIVLNRRGNEIGRLRGYRPPETFITELEQLAANKR